MLLVPMYITSKCLEQVTIVHIYYFGGQHVVAFIRFFLHSIFYRSLRTIAYSASDKAA